MMWALSSTKIFLTNIISTLTLRGLQTDCSCDGQERAGHCGGHEDTSLATPHSQLMLQLGTIASWCQFFLCCVCSYIKTDDSIVFNSLCISIYYQTITED